MKHPTIPTSLPLRAAIWALPLLLAACSSVPPSSVPLSPAAQWQAPLPHHGSTAQLAQWWQQLNDPLLVDLIDAAQSASPTMATARSRVAQARTTRRVAGAALGPTADATGNASRGFNETLGTVATTAQVGLQAGWEIDLFGANAATRDAAQARLEGAQAGWHDARVAVAAEVAQSYVSLRSCQRQLAVARFDATSRSETARLIDLATQAGFETPANLALARASSAEAAARAINQLALCDLDVKALVYLSALDEAPLRQRLAQTPEPPAPEALFAIPSVPAQVLAQRPDVFTAAREVAAASAEVGNAEAQRYPRLTLTGSIGAASVRTQGNTVDLNTWAIGPLAATLPLFDGGRRVANVDAAVARYEEAAALYRARARQAVREVEEALVTLNSASSREADVQTAATGYRTAFEATQALYRGGLTSLVDLEDARRRALAAEINLLAVQRERMSAWVTLYRAVGGGWSAADVAGTNPDQAATTTTNTAAASASNGS
ncbi:efflux transporter outer membrane subunit [Variovorax sp. HJSM1_2]|uniref:efflux transporter outer membrane subunit n=1 Tax=Variovorax sp. HJSM1_2 TaxID=3366263 RepID=UPI003BE55167